MLENFTNGGWKETKQLGNNGLTIHNRYFPEPQNIVVVYTGRAAPALAGIVALIWQSRTVHPTKRFFSYVHIVYLSL